MKFSFVIPVYSSPFLYELYDSLVHQTYNNWEAFFVDDGSNDRGKTKLILNDIKKKDTRINVIFQENQGIGGAVNNGLAYTTGDYVMILGHDDCLSSDVLSKAFETAVNTNADIISPNVDMFFNELDHRFIWNERHGIDIDKLISGHEAFIKTFPWQVHGWNFYRGSIIRNTLFPTFTSYNADEYAYRELMLKSQFLAFSEGFYMYRFVQNSITNHISLRYFDVFETHFALYALASKYKIDEECIQDILYEFYLDLLDRMKILCNKKLTYTYDAATLTRTGFDKFKDLKLSRFRFRNTIHFLLFNYSTFDISINLFKIWFCMKRISQGYKIFNNSNL